MAMKKDLTDGSKSVKSFYTEKSYVAKSLPILLSADEKRWNSAMKFNFGRSQN
ncbi:MAG: hypothetical protein LBE16_01410 [Clostridiales Family XIII bacterium]|nr:hypothetical protein [Clostridiales Family XIII bacterium]